MKKLLLLCFVCMLSIHSFAQIDMFEEGINKKVEPEIIPYDSMYNMKPQSIYKNKDFQYDFNQLIGQTIMYCGYPYDKSFLNKKYRPYKVGSYYKIIGTLPDSTCRYTGTFNARMTLVDIKTGDTIGTSCSSNLDIPRLNYEWVIVGHFEKLKSLYLNKDFVYVGTENVVIPRSGSKANYLINWETDTITKNIKKGTVWKCVGVQVKPRKEDDDMNTDNRSPIVLLFDNPTYGKHYCYWEGGDGKPYKPYISDAKPYVCGRFQLKSYYDTNIALSNAKLAERKAALTKKYGAANAEMIIKGVVKIGMTKAMCKESWGSPDDINTTTGSWGTSEQWVYGNSYLYFENNKLTAIQQ